MNICHIRSIHRSADRKSPVSQTKLEIAGDNRQLAADWRCTTGLPMKKLIVASAVLAGSVLGLTGVASADSGQHLGQLGQECAALFGAPTLGSGFHTIVQLFGNNAGGVPLDLLIFCPQLLP